jgi:hypothetical protein
MNEQEILISLAILRTNWEDRPARSYVDSFLPFVADVMQTDGALSCAPVELKAQIADRFGFDIPAAALSTILKRASRKGLGRLEHGRFIPNPQRLSEYDLTETRTRLARQQNTLIDRLRRFAGEVHDTELDAEAAASMLASYIDHHSVALLRTSLTGSPPPVQTNDSTEYLVGSFIVRVADAEIETFEYIENLIKGSMLATVLYLPRIGEAGARFANTTLYLDTPVLLSVLGYKGPESQAIATEALTRAYALGASLAYFEQTLTETRGVLAAAGDSLRRRGSAYFPPSRVERQFVESGYTSADVELILANLEADLAAIHIKARQTPPHQASLTVDEVELEATLNEEVHYVNPLALRHDLDCLTAIHRLRRGQPQFRLEDARALFITNNSALSRAARSFFEAELPDRAWPLALLDDELGTLVWLKDPVKAPSLPRLQILADSFAALEPRTALWHKYLREIDRLNLSGEVSEEQVYALRYSLAARQALMSTTGADHERLSASVVKQILQKTETDLQAPLKDELEAARIEAAKAAAAESGSAAELLEARQLAARLDAQTRRFAARWAARAGWLAAGTLYLILGASILLSVYFSLPPDLFHTPSVATGPARGLLIAAVLLAAVLLLLHQLDFSPRHITRTFRLYVESHVSGFLLRDIAKSDS